MTKETAVSTKLRPMPLPKVHEDQFAIVLRGNFNPAIFQPAWFAAKGLIRESEATAAAIEMVHPELAQFRAGWLQVSVTRDRFVATTEDPACQGPLRDLVVGTFELLEQTPTTALGLNRAMQVDLLDDGAWHGLGHLIVPKEPWANILEKPGLRAVLMEGERTDRVPGRRFFRVEPSLKHAHTAFVEVNCEYWPDQKVSGDNTSYFVGRIRTDWDRVMREARAGIEALIERATKEKPK
jgi:hypothetical protein